MASMTERCFGSPDKCWRASWAKGEGANQPTKGWCTPHNLSHVSWRGGAPPPSLGGNPPPAWLGGQVSLGFSLGRSNLLGRRPLGETLGRLPLPLAPIYSGGFGAAQHTSLSLSPKAQPYLSPSSSLVVLGEALLEYRAPPPPPRRCAAAGRSLHQPLPLSSWIKAWETSPSCMCVERRGAVVRRLDRNRPRSELPRVRLPHPRSSNASA